MIIKNKFNGYSRDGSRLYPGGDSSGSAPTSQNITQTTIPEYARPYVESMLGKNAALIDQPYQTYSGQRIAGFDPMQLQAQQSAANLGPSRQLGTATQMAGLAGLRAGNMQYDPTTFGNQFTAPSAYDTGTFDTQSFAQPGSAEAYMSPYMQSVVGMQQREAQRAADIAGSELKGKAAQMGAFGGSRQGVLEAEAARNLATQKGDIQSAGSQAAFQQAQQQFNAEQQRRQQAQQMSEQSRQYGAGMGMTAAQQEAQYGLAGQQAGEQSKQFGANLGLQGIQQQLAAAGTMGQLGQTQFGQQKDIINAQANAGAQRQAQEQQLLSQRYGDFQRQQQFPYQQLSYMSDMLRGLPMSQSTQSMYAAPPSAISQIGGAAIAGKYAGLFKKGGAVKASKKSAGLAALALKRMG
jgi:hypothetical protein